jgi:hypothetical protein
VTKSGMNFSGYWFGPYVFEPRVIDAFTPYVRTYAGISSSPAAFAAAYGLDGWSMSDSCDEPPASRSPYTSSVDTCTSRCPLSRTCSSSTWTPWKFVCPNSSAERTDRSTCVSAAKLTIASQPRAARATFSGSAMSPSWSATSAGRFARLPE